ncbi:hypothetical protein sce8144 [Sorangium cellulosum So ce56]|uniref:DUF2169 domain-containing protein n=1 Tax=Sorangium cellulosum (strain So ce56) TaxID=448385 RepID=A9FMB8_SORC5|nr:hypothetical protein sce8144 [Sorangium cellulosum So ce56]
MEVVTAPSPVVCQMSGTDPEGRNILAVLFKVTYTLTSEGRVHRAREQAPLTLPVVNDPENKSLLAADTDLYPHKLATDVVLKGHAYAYEDPRSFDVSLGVEGVRKTIRVVGDRRCTLSSTGQILFSPPEPVTRVPLRYDRAYGGQDRAATARYGNPFDGLRPFLSRELASLEANPYDYPRNPAGRGYLIEPTPAAIERLELPNLEDPLDPLTPERLVCGHVEHWPSMPLPQAMDWVGLGWFPRLAYFGVVPEHKPFAGLVAEAARGYAPADILQEKPIAEKFDFRCASGASLGLQLPYLTGGEQVELINLHPRRPRLMFRLPAERPKIWTDGRKGKLNETNPVIHTVLIEPDEGRVSVLWRGSAPALRPYLPDELERMPLRVEIP